MCYRLPAGSGRAGMVVVVALVRVCRFSSGCVAGGQSVVVWSCRLWGDQIFGYLSRCAGAGGSRSAGLVWSLLVPGARCLVWVGLLPSGHLGVALALVLQVSGVMVFRLRCWWCPGRLGSLVLALPAPLVWWSRPAASLRVSPGGTWPTLALDAPWKRPGTLSETLGNALRNGLEISANALRNARKRGRNLGGTLGNVASTRRDLPPNLPGTRWGLPGIGLRICRHAADFAWQRWLSCFPGSDVVGFVLRLGGNVVSTRCRCGGNVGETLRHASRNAGEICPDLVATRWRRCADLVGHVAETLSGRPGNRPRGLSLRVLWLSFAPEPPFLLFFPPHASSSRAVDLVERFSKRVGNPLKRW